MKKEFNIVEYEPKNTWSNLCFIRKRRDS
jgi:hypothetical protein